MARLPNFQAALATAKQTEADVLKLLLAHFPNSVGHTSYHGKSHDIRLEFLAHEFTFEVKEDFRCKRSGNVALEYECRGKPSGISTSNADYWVYRLHRPDDSVVHLLIPFAELQKAVNDKLYFRQVVGGDTGSNTKLYLFKLDVFLKLGKFLD